MADSVLHLRALPAGEVIDKFVAFAQEAHAGSDIQFLIEPVIAQLAKNVQCRTEELASRREIVELRQIVEERPFLELQRVKVTFMHGNNHAVRYNVKDPGVATLTLENISDPVTGLHVIDHLSRHFTFTSAPQIAYDKLPQPIQDGLRVQEVALHHLSAEVSKLAAFTLELQKRNSEHVSKLTADLESQSQLRRSELEQEFQAKHQSLVEREELLKKQRDEFDLRTNTVVRRDLLTKMEKLLEKQQKVELSAGTRQKRWPIHILCGSTMAIGLAVFAVALVHILYADQFDWRRYLMGWFGGVVFVSTLVYYIRFNDHWFREHSDAEIANRKLHADFLRASWIAELVFETRADLQLPESLLSRFSTELFESTSKPHTRHPADAAEDLIKRLVKVTSDGVEFEPQARSPKPARFNTKA